MNRLNFDLRDHGREIQNRFQAVFLPSRRAISYLECNQFLCGPVFSGTRPSKISFLEGCVASKNPYSFMDTKLTMVNRTDKKLGQKFLLWPQQCNFQFQLHNSGCITANQNVNVKKTKFISNLSGSSTLEL